MGKDWRTTEMHRCRLECVSRVEKEKFLEPPSGLKPQATATASSRVDFPVPFSPTRKATSLEKRSRPPFASQRTAGSCRRYSSSGSRFSATALRYFRSKNAASFRPYYTPPGAVCHGAAASFSSPAGRIHNLFAKMS